MCVFWLCESLLWQVGVRVFHEEDVDTGLSFLKLNEVGPATTEMVDNEIKRLLQVNMSNDDCTRIFWNFLIQVFGGKSNCPEPGEVTQ